MDLDNNKLYFSKNGTWQNSGVPTSGSTGTGAIDISDGYNYCFITEDYASSGNRYMDTNFGNGYFGTQQYLVQELTQVVMEYLNMMYQQAILLYQQKD